MIKPTINFSRLPIILIFICLSVFFLSFHLHADANFRGLTGLVMTPTAFVGSAIAYQSVNGISQSVVLQPFFGNVFEGCYLKHFNGDGKTQYNVKMRLFDEGMLMPAFAGGFFDLKESVHKRQFFLAASKKVPGFDLLFNVGMMRNIVTNKNELYAGFEKSILSMITLQGEYMKETETWNAGVKFKPYPGLSFGIAQIDIENSDSDSLAYSISFEKGF